MQFRAVPSNTTLINLTSGDGITITGATGTLAIHLTNEQTASMPAAQYRYELEITSDSDIITRLIQGLVVVDGQLLP
jgi:hypothetical protein